MSTNPTAHLGTSVPDRPSASSPGAARDEVVAYGRLPVVGELSERIIALSRLQRFLLEEGEAMVGPTLAPEGDVEVLCFDANEFADAWNLVGQHAPASALTTWSDGGNDYVRWSFGSGVGLKLIGPASDPGRAS